jgi:catechol-2,3-dioxygenase
VVEGGPDELKEVYRRVRATGAEIEMKADHGVSKSFYFFDPDGNRLEVFYQALHGAEAMDFMRKVGAMMEPYGELDAD